jgi:ATP-dependent DNA helicase RecG
MDKAGVVALAGKGESFRIEFKRAAAGSMNDSQIVESVVCMANGAGGTILLGVEDDGIITGAAPRHDGGTSADLLRAMILNKTEPPTAVRVEVVDVDGRDVVVIEVSRSHMPVGTRDGVFKRRATRLDGRPECIPYRPHDMLSAAFSLNGLDYAEVVLPDVGMADLDAAEFDRFRRLAAAGTGDRVLADADSTTLLRALRLLRTDVDGAEGVTLGAVLLFGSADSLSRWVPTAECLFQVVDSRGRIERNDVLRAPLLRCAEVLFEQVGLRNSEQEVMMGLLRIGVPRIPPAVMRESIANALVHRDYATLGPIQVQMRPDQFRVTSPGGLPPGISLANMVEQSRPRSPLLAEVFKRAGIVDRTGRGVQEMFMALLDAGRGGPDYSESTDASVTVTIQTTDADLDMVRFIAKYETENTAGLGLTEKRMLHEIKEAGRPSASELQAALSLVPSAVRRACTRLVELGLVQAHGSGRSRTYQLSSAFYGTADNQNAYVRLAPVQAIQQEQMIAAFVESYGRITRGQAADLLQLQPLQARYVLQRMTATGKLELRGERRAAHYVAGPTAGR